MKRLLLAMVGLISLQGAATVPGTVQALKVIDALSTPNELSVRGTINNNFLAGANATCSDAAFTLFGNGKTYQGTVYCRESAIAPGGKTWFHLTFPPVTPGAYYLRYTKAQSPTLQYEITPIRLRIKTDK